MLVRGRLFVGFNFFLKGSDLVPGTQPTPDNSKIKLFHEDCGLVKTEQHFSRDFLLSEHIAMPPFYPNLHQVFCYLSRVPLHDLLFCPT